MIEAKDSNNQWEQCLNNGISIVRSKHPRLFESEPKGKIERDIRQIINEDYVLNLLRKYKLLTPYIIAVLILKAYAIRIVDDDEISNYYENALRPNLISDLKHALFATEYVPPTGFLWIHYHRSKVKAFQATIYPTGTNLSMESEEVKKFFIKRDAMIQNEATSILSNLDDETKDRLEKAFIQKRFLQHLKESNIKLRTLLAWAMQIDNQKEDDESYFGSKTYRDPIRISTAMQLYDLLEIHTPEAVKRTPSGGAYTDLKKDE